MERVLEDIWPIMGIEQDCILSRQGDITIAYQLRLPEIFTLSDSDYEGFHQAWIRAIKILPTHTILHKQDWFTETTYQAKFNDEDPSFLSGASERFFHESPFLSHECYLFLTKKPADRRLSSSLFLGLTRKSIVPDQVLDLRMLNEFQDYIGQFAGILEDSGYTSLERMVERALLSGPDHQGILERYSNLSGTLQTPVSRDISFRQGIRVGDKHTLLFTLADPGDLPGLCGPRVNYDRYSTDRTRFSTGFAAPLGLLLPCNHIYNQYIFLEDGARMLKQLESKRLRLQSLSHYSRENALAREATDDFLNEAVSSGRMPVKAHFNVLAWTDEPALEKTVKNQVVAALAQMEATPRQETVGAPQIYWAGIPGNEAEFPAHDRFDCFAEQAACFFNLETGYRSSISPLGIRLGDRLTGKPCHVDLSDEPMKAGVITNRNKIIIGPTGSGKSFFTNHMVRSYYEQGSHVVLVDVGHSYRGLCELVKGYYFTYSENDPIRFNPFYIAKGDSLDTEKKESIKTLLLSLWKKDNEAFTRSEYVALSSVLQLYFEFLEKNPEVFPGFNSFYEYLRDVFTEVVTRDKLKEKDFDISNFLYVLRPFYQKGEFDYLLNATENLDLLHQRFMVFELDNIKDHPILFPVVTLIIMELFVSKMRKLKGIRKMILIEEAWKAIAREGMAEYIKFLFKTVRKYYGEAIVVTQEIDDIVSSAIVKETIIHNADCKILLDQSKYQNKFDQVQQLLGLTDKEKTLVLSINRANDPNRKYKEVFISLGGIISNVYRTEVSLEEYLVYTTEELEKMRVMAYAHKYGDLRTGIAALARNMRAEGKTGA